MTERTDVLRAMIEECLEEDIEPYLESIGLPLTERPFRASLEFAETYFQWINEGNEEICKIDDFSDYAASPEFRIIYRHVENWYKGRFGNALVKKNSAIKGVVMIYGVPFVIKMPTTVVRPGKVGEANLYESIWVRIPSSVLDSEDIYSWVVDPPNFLAMKSEVKIDLERDVREIASALRSIRTNFMGAGGEGETLGLQKGTICHLETFVDYIFSQDSTSIQKAYWELQMACETAFKAVSKYKTGKFRETHDLFSLYDDVNAIVPLSISRDILKSLPRWKETTVLRYAVGSRENLKDCFNCYLTTLRILKALVEDARLGGIQGLGSAEFEIGCPPWFGT
ncbi:hypothetical protein GAY33_17350 [Azospirillum brasilense]|uniref:hypothetical protein n=1 Tax=Azospirillum argentinense TaxID=2970906 RepID=UPI00190EC2B5|nr:hypothetical protein [Azospirillum argentinense]MBK3800971.1 hypothetical protein [Azospirillum argentinense]